MSTKKKVVLVISLFIIGIVFVFIGSGNQAKYQRTKLQRLETKLQRLESGFKAACKWYDDDEEKIEKILNDAISLKSCTSSVELKGRIDILIIKCENEL